MFNVLDRFGNVMNAEPYEAVDGDYARWLAQDNANVFGEPFTVLNLVDGTREVFTPVQESEES